MKKLFILIFVIAWLPLFGQSQEINQLVEEGLHNNMELQQLESSLLDQQKNQQGWILIDQSRLSLSGNWNLQEQSSSGIESNENENLTGSVSLQIPLLEQFSLSAQVNQDGQTSIDVSLTPFGGSTSSLNSQWNLIMIQEELDLRQEEISEELFLKILEYPVIQDNARLLEAQLELREAQYMAGQALYERGVISYDDLQNLSDLWLESSSKYTEGQSKLIQSDLELRTLLGGAIDELPIFMVEVDQLVEWITERDAEIKSLQESSDVYSTTLTRLSQELEVTAQELRLSPLFEPELNISAQANFDDQQSSASLSVTMVLSRDSFQAQERQSLKEEQQRLSREYSLESYGLDLQLEGNLQQVEIRRVAYDLAQAQFQRLTTLLEETELLFQQGDRTTLELDQARLDHQQAQASLYEAAINLLEAQGQVILLYI